MAPVVTATRPKWGVYDTVDLLWLGDDHGPKLFDEEIDARIAAQIIDVRLKQMPGRSRAKEFLSGPVHLRDEKKPAMSTLAALKAIENGEL